MIQLSIPPEHLNVIYTTLAEKPYREVAEIIANLKGQVQMHEAQKRAETQGREQVEKANAEELAKLREEAEKRAPPSLHTIRRVLCIPDDYAIMRRDGDDAVVIVEPGSDDAVVVVTREEISDNIWQAQGAYRLAALQAFPTEPQPSANDPVPVEWQADRHVPFPRPHLNAGGHADKEGEAA